LLGTAIEHTLKGLKVAAAFASGNISRPRSGMIVTSCVGVTWLI
jgi:hypothetical protein